MHTSSTVYYRFMRYVLCLSLIGLAACTEPATINPTSKVISSSFVFTGTRYTLTSQTCPDSVNPTGMLQSNSDYTLTFRNMPFKAGVQNYTWKNNYYTGQRQANRPGCVLTFYDDVTKTYTSYNAVYGSVIRDSKQIQFDLQLEESGAAVSQDSVATKYSLTGTMYCVL